MLNFVRSQGHSRTFVDGVEYVASTTAGLCKALVEAGVAEETPVRCYADTGTVIWAKDYPMTHFLQKGAAASPVATEERKGRGSWFSRLSSNLQGTVRADLEKWNEEGLSTGQMANKLVEYGVAVSMASVHKVLVHELGIVYNRQRG